MANATTTSNTSANVTYTRLSTSSSSDGINSPNKTNATRTRSSSIGSGHTCTRTRSERLSDKFQALLWVGAAYLTIRHTNFFITLFHHPEIYRPCLLVAVLGFSVNVVFVLYLVVYVDKILKIRAPWEVYCPSVIPTMTGIGVVTFILFIRAVFPVWGFMSPLILGIVSFGGMFGLQFIPWF